MSTPAASVAFSEHAAHYSAMRRRLVPGYDAFYGAAVDALRLPGAREVRRVLDLGAGTGLLTERVAAAFPGATFDLLDGSAEMLAEARTRLSDRIGAVHVQDMAAGLPSGPWDAVISGLAIHHIESTEVPALLRSIHEVLAPGGVFVNAEQVTGPTPELNDAYLERWRADCAALGASPEEIDAAAGRRTHDRCVDVATQLAWLGDAGFATVDCLYKSWGFATLVAIRGGR